MYTFIASIRRFCKALNGKWQRAFTTERYFNQIFNLVCNGYPILYMKSAVRIIYKIVYVLVNEEYVFILPIVYNLIHYVDLIKF